MQRLENFAEARRRHPPGVAVEIAVLGFVDLVERLRANGVSVVFSGLKQQVLQVMRNTGLYDYVGEDNMFRTEDNAVDALFRRIDDPAFDPAACPLRPGNA